MRIFGKAILSAFLSIALIQAPVMAAPAGTANSPLGVVLQADHALIDSAMAATGASVFAGNRLQTDSGSMRVRFGASQAYLPAGSAAVLSQVSQGFGAELTRGTIVLSSVQGETFRLIADGALIRPSTTQATSAQITLVSPTELVLLARKGALEVSMDDDIKTVSEGASYRMLIQPSDAAGGPGGASAAPYPAGQRRGGGVISAGRNRFLLFALTAVAVGVGVGVYFSTVSPHKPQ